MSQYVMAIDQGTTGTTVCLVNKRGEVVAKSNSEFRQIFPKPGWVEHDLEDIWASVKKTMIKVLKLKKIKPSQIAAIGITNQRETVGLWNASTHKPLHNAIVWQCRRTTETCEKMKKKNLEPLVKRKTGLVLDPYFSATKISWILDNVKGARSLAKSQKIKAGTMDTYLMSRLSSGEIFATDVSNASRTLLFNLKTGKWDDELLKTFKVPRNILPTIKPSSGVFGHTKGLDFLPDGIPISGVAGDQQAALFGQTCFQEGMAKCTFGTGSFLLMNTGKKIIRSKSGLLTTVAWQLGEGQPMTYALEGGAFICGAAVQWLRDQLGLIKKASDIESLAAKVESSEGVEFVPALAGLGAPYWEPDARGVICGLTRGSSRSHIARATLDAMALQNAEILLAMQKDLGKKMRSLRVDGGASANKLLMQIQADVLGAKIERPKLIETTVAGAAYLAGLGSGYWRSLKEISKVSQVEKSFTSRATQKQRGDRLQRWKGAVKKSFA